MKAWVDRKIFIHNLGHAVLCYHTSYSNPELEYIWEALEIETLKNVTRQTMIQSMEILMALYPNEFTKEQLLDHIDDLLDRFSNRSLGDTIYRVGCDLSRKLNKDDRLMIPIIAAMKTKKEYTLILEAWVKGFFFNVVDKNGNMLKEDEKFIKDFDKDPLSYLSSEFDSREYAELYNGVHEILNRMGLPAKNN